MRLDKLYTTTNAPFYLVSSNPYATTTPSSILLPSKGVFLVSYFINILSDNNGVGCGIAIGIRSTDSSAANFEPNSPKAYVSGFVYNSASTPTYCQVSGVFAVNAAAHVYAYYTEIYDSMQLTNAFFTCVRIG